MNDDIYLTITGIDLPTLKDIAEMPDGIKYIQDTYWTKSPNLAPYVYTYSLFGRDTLQCNNYAFYRPVLEIEGLDDVNLRFFQKLEIFNLDWFYLGDNKVICATTIADEIFDPCSNIYKNSFAQRFLEKWLEEQKAKEN